MSSSKYGFMAVWVVNLMILSLFSPFFIRLVFVRWTVERISNRNHLKVEGEEGGSIWARNYCSLWKNSRESGTHNPWKSSNKRFFIVKYKISNFSELNQYTSKYNLICQACRFLSLSHTHATMSTLSYRWVVGKCQLIKYQISENIFFALLNYDLKHIATAACT